MDVHGVLDQVRPQRHWSLGLAADSTREVRRDTDGSFGDRVEIVIVGRAHLRIDREAGPERLEQAGLEGGFVVRTDHFDPWLRQWLALVVAAHVYRGVEPTDDAGHGVDLLAGFLGFEELHEDEA